MVDYLLCRKCSHCGKPMTEGYVIANGLQYYCSDSCLHQNIDPIDYEEMYDNGNGDSYWTTFEEDKGDVYP